MDDQWVSNNGGLGRAHVMQQPEVTEVRFRVEYTIMLCGRSMRVDRLQAAQCEDRCRTCLTRVEND